MTNKFTLILDSSQISSYLDCPMFWHYMQERRLLPAGLPTESAAMNSGTYGHKLLDILYREKLKGSSTNEILEKAFAYDPDKDTCECGCPMNMHEHVDLNIEGIQECRRCKKCVGTPRPKQFQLSQDDRFAVRNRFRDYVFFYQNNDIMPINEEYIEVGFSEPIYEDYENYFVLEGRIDLIGTLQGLQIVMDHKFQLRRHELYAKSIQFKNYAMVSGLNTFMINYIRLSKNMMNDTFERRIVSFNRPELNAWKQHLIKIFFDVKNSIVNKSYRQNWAACPGRFNYECYYTKLCEEIDPQMRSIKEQQLYQINTNMWRPW